MPESNDPNSFRGLFCSHFGCADAEFETAALKKMIHRRWMLFTVVMLKIRPSFFKTDLQIIQQLGRVTSRSNLMAEVRDLRADYARFRDFGFLRRALKLRLSGERILRVAGMLWR